MNLTPNSWGSLKEFNQCHDAQGRFCDASGGVNPGGGVLGAVIDLARRLRSGPKAPAPSTATIDVITKFMPDGLDRKLFGTLSVEAVAQRLAAHMPGQPIRVRIISDSSNSVSLFFSGTGLTQKRTFSLTDKGEKRLSHDTFLLQPGVSNRGLGKTVLQDAFDLYRELGYTTVETYANVDVGAYAWARYGFYPSTPKAHRLVARMLENMWDSYMSGRQRGRQEYYDLSKNGSRSVVVTTEMSAKAKNGVEKLIKRIEQGDRRAFWALTDARVPGVREDGKRVDFKIGKWLLQHVGWEAELNLNDPVAMKRFRKYIGGR
jgi:GNAT superfamily N-acetyltransferase